MRQNHKTLPSPRFNLSINWRYVTQPKDTIEAFIERQKARMDQQLEEEQRKVRC